MAESFIPLAYFVQKASQPMTGTAIECRAHAMDCLKQAETETPSGRITLLAIAQQWLRLAADIENADTFLEVMNYIDKTWESERPTRTNGGGDKIL